LEALMKKCKAFTLVELLVVIGIIALLAGILLPAVNLMRKRAMITGEKADFEAIASALNAYKADFGDYPRNVNLPQWNTLPGPVTPAPVFYSLATALLGPGPASTAMIGGNLEIGDGSDGPGFRCQITGAIPGTIVGSVTAGSLSATILFNAQYGAQAAAFAQNFVAPTSPSSPSPTPASITFFAGNGSDLYPETVSIASVTPPAAGKLSLTFSSAALAPHNGTCIITQPSGKVWGPYISADTFKVAFIPMTDNKGNLLGGGGATNPMGGYGQPVLLDRWGQVIQYFPAYGTAGNRANDSYLYPTPSTATLAAISVGPLYGYSQPWSLENKLGTSHAENAIWDFRDGVPFFSASSLTIANQPWPDPTVSPDPNNFYPNLAIQWMLGDQPDPTNNTLDNVIKTSEKFANPGPYILISAGPDGPGRTNGGFCNMADSTGNPILANTWQQAFINSGNIYNFDRQ
jgi:prepilin-type N-terminal cleavage/methylation domain-containing protein